MNLLVHIFRLSRPINLLIVMITMVVMRYVVFVNLTKDALLDEVEFLSWWKFSLIVASAVLLTASGNIINDYFDRKVDLINKPERVIIDRFVKRRVAIILHPLLNALAVFLVMIVCYNTGFWLPLFFPLVISILLWWYTPVFKKMYLVGNIVVAVCTSLAPAWALAHDIEVLFRSGAVELTYRVVIWTSVVMAAAFILTLIREVVKDIEDIEGDTKEQFRTLPIVSGVEFAKRYAMGWMLFFLAGVGLVMLKLKLSQPYLAMLFLASFIGVPVVMSLVSIIKARSKYDFHRAGNFLKWLMLGGILALALVSFLAI